MPNLRRLPVKILHHFDPKRYQHAGVGCLVLSGNKKIVLQLRDHDAPTFPGRLATFGGGIEQNETPMAALVRELKEELGAIVNPREVVAIAIISEPETNYRDVEYLYFWHDARNTITGCYEGKAKYFNTIADIDTHPNVMTDVRWLLEECQKRKLLPNNVNLSK